MRLAAGEVFAQRGYLSGVAEAASIEDVAERGGMVDRLMVIAEAAKCLIFASDVPIHPRVPLEGVVDGIGLAGEVVVSLSRDADVRRRKQTQQPQRNRVERDAGLIKPIARDGGRSVRCRIRTVELNGIAVDQIGVQQFAKVAGTHQRRRYRET